MISEPLLHKMKILVVDDDRMSVTLLEQLLQRRGYSHVMGITDSRKALDICATFDPDLILLDLIMPEMDGFALLEALREDGSESFLPIVVLTADITEEARARALEAGATDFLVKPVSQAEAHHVSPTFLILGPAFPDDPDSFQGVRLPYMDIVGSSSG